MIRQEIWALLCACQLVHITRAAAAHAGGGLDPDRISDTVTLRALRRRITTGHRTTSRGDITREIPSPLLPRRRHRSYPRLTRASTALRRDRRTRRHGPLTITMDADP